MVETVNTTIPLVQQKQSADKQKKIANTIQTDIDSFVRRPHSLSFPSQHKTQPVQKKQKIHHNTQQLLHTSNSLPLVQLTTSEATSLSIHNRVVSCPRENMPRFKRCHVTPPDSTFDLRSEKLVSQARTSKLRKTTRIQNDPIPSYRT